MEHGCPKCEGTMRKGILVVTGSGMGVNWVEGESGFLNTPRARMGAYSCADCGYVEFYVSR